MSQARGGKLGGSQPNRRRGLTADVAQQRLYAKCPPLKCLPTMWVEVMNMVRMVERLSGLASGVVGLLTLAFLLFGPASHYMKSVTTCTGVPNNVSCTSTGLDHVTTGAIRIDLFPLSIFLMSVVVLLFVVLAVSAALHSRSGTTLWQACLWASTALLVILVLLTLHTLWLALAPALVLAVVASGAAWSTARQRMEQDDVRHGLARSMEEICGVAAGLFGLAASVYLLIAPNQGTSQSSACDVQGICHTQTTGSPSPLVADPVRTLLLAGLALAFFGLLALSAVRHARSGAPVWRAWMGACSLLLLLLSFLGGFSIGLFFLPSAVLALFAAISSFGPARPVLRGG